MSVLQCLRSRRKCLHKEGFLQYIFLLLLLTRDSGRKFTSNEMSVPFSLNLLIISTPVFQSLFTERQSNSGGMKASGRFIYTVIKFIDVNSGHGRMLSVIDHARFSRVCSVLVVIHAQSCIFSCIVYQIIITDSTEPDLILCEHTDTTVWNS